MLEHTPQTLDHSTVHAAKAKWIAVGEQSPQPRKHSLTFEDFFEHFKIKKTFSAIAKLAGLSRERVRQIYDTYFADIFGKENGHDRLRSCVIARRLAEAKCAESVLFAGAMMQKLVEKARQAGCIVEAIPLYSKGVPMGSVRRSTLLFNGHRCNVHFVNKATKTRKRGPEYAVGHISVGALSTVTASVYFVAIPGSAECVYVLKSEFLRKIAPISKDFPLYFPLCAQKRKRCRINWEKYKNAWHLLPAKPDPIPK